MPQHHISDNVNSFNNINVWNTYTVADKRSEILAWLSPLEPRIRHHDIQTRRVDEVGGWLLRTQEYRNWFGGIREGETDGAALFCYGGPGVGKTFISSLVIDTLCKQAVGGNAVVACFYFDFAAQEEQSPAAVLGAVLKQVVSGLEEIPERIVKAFRGRERAIGGQRLALAEIVECLQDISSSRRTFICVDALDECPPGNRVKLLNSLNQVLQKSPGARIFLTGRQHISGEIERHLTGRAVTRSIKPTKNDVIIFLRAKLKEDTMPDAMDQSLEEEIMKNIPKTISEIFLFVFLSIEMILQETTIYRRRQRLSAVKNGSGLGGVYEATLGRIKAQGGDKARFGMAALMWITHSRRPLRVDEICHAIAIPIGSNDLDNDDIPAISTLLGCCQGLVTVDKGASTVRLIHFTLQEHLCARPNIFERAHSTMAETCLTYLNFQHVKDLSVCPSPNPRRTPFLKYSSLYWGTHMRVELSDRAKTFALQLLDQFDGHISAKILWESISRRFITLIFPWEDIPAREGFSALHCISYFGMAEVASVLIKTKRWDVNQRDGVGVTPLIWAARYGHEEVVRLLLRKKDIQSDQQDRYNGRTALSWAAGNGHERVVRLFLGRQFFNPGSVGRRWGKAARVVGFVFGGRYANPDSSSKSGRTPLSWAARNGHEGVVELLLERGGASPDTPDVYGRTPLAWAAMRDHEGIVKLLLGREDVNPNTLDGVRGQTPLLWAAEKGHEGMVKLLLGREDANSNAPDTMKGQTPLLWAVEKGHEGVVRLLLGRGDVNPNTADMKYGQTPLSWAAESGHEGIVKLLLGQKDVNPNTADTEYGRTPLAWAAENRHEGVVKLLLGREDVNPNTPDTMYGQAPLSRAAEKGHEGMVKLLLGREDLNPNTPDTMYDQTPLSWAAEKGHEGIVKLLLGRKDINPDNPCELGQKPHSWAARNGRQGIVKLLLGRKDVNPDSSCEFDRTPSVPNGPGHSGNGLGRYRPNSSGLRKPIKPDRRL